MFDVRRGRAVASGVAVVMAATLGWAGTALAAGGVILLKNAHAIGPKPDDPRAIGPKQDDPVKAIGPKQDDPVKAIGPKQDDPIQAIGPKPDDPVQAIGPKPEDPSGPVSGTMNHVH